MITTEYARQIADNPDGCFREDVQALADYIGDGVNPVPQAAALWPNNEVEKISGYKPNGWMGRVYVATKIAEYCRFKAKAMELREAGQIERAILEEKNCNLIYAKLPQWAKW